MQRRDPSPRKFVEFDQIMELVTRRVGQSPRAATPEPKNSTRQQAKNALVSRQDEAADCGKAQKR